MRLQRTHLAGKKAWTRKLGLPRHCSHNREGGKEAPNIQRALPGRGGILGGLTKKTKLFVRTKNKGGAFIWWRANTKEEVPNSGGRGIADPKKENS